MLSRREFGKVTLAALPVALSAAPLSGYGHLGVATESFRDLPRTPGKDNVDDIIRAVMASGASEIDLASVNTEAPDPDTGLPPPPPPGPYGGPPAGLTPAELAARNLAVRNNLRKWRLATPPSHYADLKAKFDAAGITVFALSILHDAAFTDDEIDVTFAHAKALGVEVVSSQATTKMAGRLKPFAERHGITVAFRNASGSLQTAQDLAAVVALSKQFRVNLDIGNFTASNQEPVAFIQENHQNITHLLIKDRTRDGGDNQPFGAGDTPIQPVLALLRDKQFPIRSCVDYEYVGLGTAPQEVRRCLAYVKQALA